MFLSHQQEGDKLKSTLNELDTILEDMQRQMVGFCQDLGTTPEQLKDYINNQDNFSAETWNMMQQEKERVKDEVERDQSCAESRGTSVERLLELREVANFLNSKKL